MNQLQYYSHCIRNFFIFFVVVKCQTSLLPEDDYAIELSKNHTKLFRIWWNDIMENYDNRIRPYFNVKPLHITLGLTVLAISSISEAHMQWTVEIYFHEYWHDPRMYFNGSDFGGKRILTLPQNAHLNIWTPDTSFINAISCEVPKAESVSHLSFLRVTEGGLMFRARRLSVTATCDMDLTMYPFDQQACKLELSSFGHNIDGIIYRWKTKRLPIELKNITLPDFDPVESNSRVVDQRYVAGIYSVPQLCIVFKRRAGFCFLQMFIPATAVVGASWISLWLENETQFNDIVSIILAIIFLSYSYNEVMPKVSYIKAMDIYLGACFIFAFLSLAKLAVVKYMRKRVIKRRTFSFVQITSETSTIENNVSHKKSVYAKNNNSDGSVLVRRNTGIQQINDHDCYWKVMKVFHVGSQLVLPLAFLVFGVFYFFIYPHLVKVSGKCF